VRLSWANTCPFTVGAVGDHLRPLMDPSVNLAIWRGVDTTEIPLPPSVARYARIAFVGGGSRVHDARFAGPLLCLR